MFKYFINETQGILYYSRVEPLERPFLFKTFEKIQVILQSTKLVYLDVKIITFFTQDLTKILRSSFLAPKSKWNWLEL